MKAKAIVDGKEFAIEIQDSELQKLLTQQKKTGYERVDNEQIYWVQNMIGGICWANESICFTGNNEYYNSANYYSDDTIAKNNARADNLMRQLRRFAVENRKENINWNNKGQQKYCIYYDYSEHKIMIEQNLYYRYHGLIYFDSDKIARLAIDTFHDELVWYFTEYKDSL